MMLVPNFPPELVEKILVLLDGVSLARSRCVCSTWNEIVNSLVEREKIWRKCCLREITPDVLVEMLGNRLCPNESQDGIEWCRVYQQWYRMKKIGSWKHQQLTFIVSDESPVTCVKITGSYVVTGHRNGDIHLWDRVEGRHISRLGHHKKMVTDMALMDLEFEGPYLFPDRELDRQLVISGSKDHVIQVNPIVATSDWLEEWRPFPMPVILRHHSDSIEYIKTFGNLMLASCADNSISIWTLLISEEHSWWPQISMTMRLFGPPTVSRFVGYWNNVVTLVCYDTKIWQFYTEFSTEWTPSSLSYTLTVNEDFPNDSVELIISNCFLFRDSVIIFLTVDNHFCVSIDGERYRATPTLAVLHSHVVAVTLAGNLLVLGTETGHVCVYYIATKNDLFKINLSKPVWSKQVSEASIIDVDVHNNSKGPVITVATTHALTVIQWYQETKKEKQRTLGMTVDMDDLCADLKSISNLELVDSVS